MILFIDDESFFNEAYFEALKESGHEVKMENNINYAIEIFTNNLSNIELVILDVMMDLPDQLPEKFNIRNAHNGMRTGVEVLRLLKEIQGAKDIPMIFLTNVADDFFYKTFSSSELLQGCYRKKNTGIFDLVNIVNKILSEHKK